MAASVAMTSGLVADPAAKVSMTSKEWVIPPRPKPGRKPATDTPPTKRKAQNRAAQRAFRERRAARVGELEEQLDQQKDIHDKEEAKLRAKIRDLEMEVQSFKSRCLQLDSMLEKERQERTQAKTRADNVRREHDRHGNGYDQSSWYDAAQQIASAHPSTDNDGTASSKDTDLNAELSLTCGNCSVDGTCACAEEVLASVRQSTDLMTQEQVLKRPSSPGLDSAAQKRPRSSELETDSLMENLDALGSASKEKCGFCEDGTYCVCADAENTTAPSDSKLIHDSLSSLAQQQMQTPPPSVNDVPPPLAMEMTADGAVKLPRRRESVPTSKKSGKITAFSPGCGSNGPGTCAQCQADPKSGLFCRLMAAQVDRQGVSGAGGGCCGSKGANGGCCKSQRASTAVSPRKVTLPSLPSLGLSCADAYKTLSSHQNFEKAAVDMGSWLPKLKAAPVACDPDRKAATMQPGMMPVEFEAASIMSVLKDFDVRFGREA